MTKSDERSKQHLIEVVTGSTHGVSSVIRGGLLRLSEQVVTAEAAFLSEFGERICCSIDLRIEHRGTYQFQMMFVELCKIQSASLALRASLVITSRLNIIWAPLFIKHMGSGNIRSADDAVSPVISVILMVAIVVILGAVVSVFALGLAESVDSPAPSASFEFKVLDDGDIKVTHAGGDTLKGEQLRFAGAALDKTGLGEAWSGDVTAGYSAEVNVKAGETLLLIWQSPETDETATLAEYDVPDDVGPTGSVSITNVQSVNDEVSISVDTLSRITGNANLVVETTSGAKVEQSVSSGATPTVSLSVDGSETVTATLYESGETGKIASDTGSASPAASIGSITDENGNSFTYLDDDIWINNVQFNGVPNDRVWIVVEDGNMGGNTSDSTHFSTYGGTAKLRLTGFHVKNGETITVTVYETNSESNILKTEQFTA